MISTGSAFESTDPNVIGLILSQLKGLQEQDHAELQGDQDSVLRSLMTQMNLISGVPSAEAGMAEGADELTVPPDDTMPVPEDYEGAEGADIDDPVLMALMQAEGGAMPMMDAGLSGDAALMGLPPEAYGALEGDMGATGLEHLSDEELLSLLGGAA